MLTDAEIMRQVQAGDVGAFDELVRRHRDPLLRVAASKLGDAGWAEDAVQEAFLAVHAARATYDPRFALRTWLWTILLNVCRRRLKRANRGPREMVRSSMTDAAIRQIEPAVGDSGLSRLLLVERQELLAAWLNELPEPQADALRLRFYGGLSFDEIAETMSSSVSGAKRRVKNGLLGLAERIRKDGGELL